MRLLVLVSWGVLLASACGGNVVVDTVGGGAGGAQGAGSGGGSVCADGGVSQLPSIYKGCSTDADCTTANTVGCCTTFVLGVATAELAAYAAYEKACTPTGGTPCDCPSGGGREITEDGMETPYGNILSVAVACTAGLCLSFTP